MFRFTIRELVLVTAIVALGAGWGLDHWRTAGQLNECRRQEKHAQELAKRSATRAEFDRAMNARRKTAAATVNEL